VHHIFTQPDLLNIIYISPPHLTSMPPQPQSPNPLCHLTHLFPAHSLSQLEQLVRQPILRRVTNSATFLKSQLPARLENHIYRLRNLPTPNSTALRELLSSTVTSKLRGLEVSQDWKLVDTCECCCCLRCPVLCLCCAVMSHEGLSCTSDRR
jgi:hypothetical protein